jgi:hypothetical protein
MVCLSDSPYCLFKGIYLILYIQAGLGRQRMASKHHPLITPSVGMYRYRMLTLKSEERHV